MQHLTIKNLVLSFLALNLFSAVALHSQLKTVGSVSGPQEAARPAMAKPATPDLRPRQPDIVKVLDLPDSETLRFNETAFVDLGWRQTDLNGGEWVGHIGSDTEYIPLTAEQITGMLKEAQLKSLPPPPAARASGDRKRQQMTGKGVEPVGHTAPDIEHVQLSGEHISGLLDDLQPLALPPVPPAATPLPETPKPDAPHVERKSAPSTPNGIDLLDFIPVMLGIFLMMYVRYRITQATLDAAQSATGMLQRALSDLFSSAEKATKAKAAGTHVVAASAPSPASTSSVIQTRAKRTSTVVRPSAGLFGMWSGAR